MRRIKNLLSLLIIITFIFNFVSLCNYSVYANVVDSRDKNDINEIIENFENPLYEGLNVKEYSPKDNINSKSVSVFNSLEEAAIFVRDEMVNRKGNISFILPKELYHSGILKELVELATEDYDNGKSSEGDYLNKHYGGCSAKIKSYSDGQYQYDINMRYLSTYEQEEQVDKAIDEVLDNLDIKGKDDYTKIKLIHDYIVENIRYDYTYSKYSAYNAIIDKSVVCQGFSTLTYKMFKEAGLKVRYISGIGNGGRHGWNIVKLGDKWYNIDNTWDSCYSESGPLSYEWFLKDKYNFPDHTRDSEYNTSEFNEKYPMATVLYNYTSSISITLNKTSLTLLEGESEKLKATINPSNATDKTVTWESSNSSVAIVDSNGNVVAIGKGEAYITANINGENVQAECKVIVKENQVKVTDIKLNKTSLTLLEGESEQLEATINPSDATNKNVIWKSGDINVAKVDDKGKVTAVGVGTARITVITEDGKKTSICEVKVVNNMKISDIKGHWAESQINKFISDGHINGYPDNTFRPNNSITRAEFVKIFNKYFGLTKKSSKSFSDTSTHWAKDEIDIAITYGVVTGYPDNTFRPDEPITREQAAKIISSYKQLVDNNFDKINKYNDFEYVSGWAKSSVEGVLEKGYMNGYPDNTFRPKSNITRAEAVVTLSRIKK